jgi:sortase A
VRSAIASLGRTLVTLGLLILLFVVYQLWGTGIFTARAQENLKSQFDKELHRNTADDPVVSVPTTTKTPGSTVTPPTVTPATVPHDAAKAAPPTPAEGDVEGTIDIPRIHLDMAFVEGTSRDDLKKGPGHYPGTPLPGTVGNAAIAGHRTTYLHPFWGVDNLVPGDVIIIRTLAGTFVYKMSQPWFTVKPTDLSVVANTLDPELTLTSCNPKGSAAQRIIIKAKLDVAKSSPPSPPAVVAPGTGRSRTTLQAGLAEGLSGQTRSLLPSVLWGLLAAIVGLAWWWTYRRWRHPLTWFVGVLPFLIALFPFYVYLERALPSGY